MSRGCEITEKGVEVERVSHSRTSMLTCPADDVRVLDLDESEPSMANQCCCYGSSQRGKLRCLFSKRFDDVAGAWGGSDQLEGK